MCPAEHLQELKSWYNGYYFGGKRQTIYNPWSILNFLKHHYALKPYWINTSSNDLIQDCLTADKLPEEKAYCYALRTAGCSKIQAYSIAFDGKRVSSQYRELLTLTH
ncbi:MAG: AAA family ATPase [Myxococcaceae bacterium]|nr:AAA family ATPase [Myxococcaceae bacterium]MBH2006058.1 AAA family ATPase [Myxococcaceae bacterium]